MHIIDQENEGVSIIHRKELSNERKIEKIYEH